MVLIDEEDQVEPHAPYLGTSFTNSSSDFRQSTVADDKKEPSPNCSAARRHHRMYRYMHDNVTDIINISALRCHGVSTSRKENLNKELSSRDDGAHVP